MQRDTAPDHGIDAPLSLVSSSNQLIQMVTRARFERATPASEADLPIALVLPLTVTDWSGKTGLEPATLSLGKRKGRQ